VPMWPRRPKGSWGAFNKSGQQVEGSDSLLQ